MWVKARKTNGGNKQHEISFRDWQRWPMCFRASTLLSHLNQHIYSFHTEQRTKLCIRLAGQHITFHCIWYSMVFVWLMNNSSKLLLNSKLQKANVSISADNHPSIFTNSDIDADFFFLSISNQKYHRNCIFSPNVTSHDGFSNGHRVMNIQS